MTTGRDTPPSEGARCYLAGPMRGYPEFNFPAFFAAAAHLRRHGYKVWSPAENDVHQDGFDPAKDAAAPMRHYMKRDLPAVLDADFVAVLSGWQKSRGAMCEVTVALACDIPVLDAATLQPAEETPRSESMASPSRLVRAIFALNAATMPVDSFGNPNIKVVRRDEAEAILREAMGESNG